MYNNTQIISKTGLDYIERSPLDYWYKFLRPDAEGYVETESTIFEKAFREAVFSPLGFKQKYVRIPKIDLRTTTGKAEMAKLQEATGNNNFILIPTDKYDSIIEMRDAITKHPVISKLCASGRVGTPQEFEEQNTGAIVRFRPHWIHQQEIIIYLVSTYMFKKHNASADNFAKEAFDFNWHKMAALQLDGMKAKAFIFVVVEGKAPYKLQAHHFDDRSMTLGKRQYIENCKTFMNCCETGIWPGLPEKVLSVSLPEFSFKGY